MTNLPGVSPALRADVLAELGGMLTVLRDKAAAAMDDARHHDTNPTRYESVAMRDARTEYVNACRTLAHSTTAYRVAIRRAIDHLEATQ